MLTSSISVPVSSTAAQPASISDEIGKLAEQCRAQNPDWDSAVDAMYQTVMNDPALFQSFVVPLVRGEIRNRIRQSAHEQRRALARHHSITSQAQSISSSDEGLARVAQHIRETLYDYQLQGGLKLGDAKTGDLSKEIKLRRANSETHRRNADFLAAVASKVPSGKRVRDALSLDQLKKLAKKHGLK